MRADRYSEDRGELIDDLSVLARRIHEAGKRVFIATLIPRNGGYLWSYAHERERLATNEWIRFQAKFDGDGTHLNTAGYRAIGDSVDLGIFAA
ncbi:hypothetical protein ACF3MZ_24050 [Paenibacillaceae bacterium WGS1546]|uniref:hypothetical protein n=1 Tax=Cohnella sp. WGS1546 TaxID=3366810 RepID=UPI00372D764C